MIAHEVLALRVHQHRLMLADRIRMSIRNTKPGGAQSKLQYFAGHSWKSVTFQDSVPAIGIRKSCRQGSPRGSEASEKRLSKNCKGYQVCGVHFLGGQFMGANQ